MACFDPFNATPEDVLALPDAHAPRGPVWQWGGAQRLIHHRAFYERNPLDGMAVCAVHDVVAPDWLARAYLRGFYAVTTCRVRSWDQAFGAPFPKGTNLAARRRARLHRVQVANLVTDTVMADPTRPIDKGLWDEIGTKVGEGVTRTEELYREALRMGIGIRASVIRGRLGRPSRPTKLRKLAGVRTKR